MANRNFPNGGRIFTQHVRPAKQTVSFQVSASSANGILSLQGAAVANVYMHNSSASASSTNPTAGNILVQMKDNYVKVLNVLSAMQSPNGSAGTSVTIGNPYIITSLGSSTPAQFQAIGLSPNIAPAVGVSFIASATGSLAGGGQIAPPSASNITNIEIIGNPSLSSSPANNGGTGIGASILLQCMKNGSLQQPADGTVIDLELFFNDSVVTAGNPSPGN